MKINVTNILLILLIGIMSWQTFTGNQLKEEPKQEIISIPEIKGTTGTQTVEKVVLQPIYLPSTDKQVNVDSAWKEKYEQALKDKDSVAQRNLYLEAIKINTYEKTLVDNDSIEIKGYARTRGSLLDYSVEYTLKPRDFSYTPKIVTTRPKLSLGLDIELGVPTVPVSDFLAKGDIYFENKKGNGFSLGYDSEQRVWVGIRKTFTIRK